MVPLVHLHPAGHFCEQSIAIHFLRWYETSIFRRLLMIGRKWSFLATIYVRPGSRHHCSVTECFFVICLAFFPSRSITQILSPLCIGGKQYFLPSGLTLVALQKLIPAEEFRLTTGHWQQIDITQQVKNYFFSISRKHPGSSCTFFTVKENSYGTAGIIYIPRFLCLSITSRNNKMENVRMADILLASLKKFWSHVRYTFPFININL